MPYSASSLSAISWAISYTRWHYQYDGDGVPPSGHFAPAWKMMRLGDQIDFVSHSHAGTLVVAHVSKDSIITYIGYSVPLIDVGEQP